ncbi:MAG: TIGR02281 family clan AA aspartic protease [Pseudolabrys sp.]|nr:TIGR02281 family clan AA aspartic protease [Pseudolabrys sp.]MCW5685329.1 TIGR02281 family clan AA aspartic protease [Pseudolabrys sp.]
MRQIVLFAAIVLVLSGVLVGKYSDKFMNPKAAMANVTPSPKPAAPGAAAYYGEMVLARGDGGHFHADGRVDGRAGIPFVVDTGASVVALRESDAARIGHRPAKGDYTARISTANGIILGARVQLDSVEIGSIKARDVAAIVLPDAALSTNLLGMSYLSKLKRFEVAGGKLILTQ